VTQQKPPAGWYDDPAGSGGRRYWNGRNWTDQVQSGTPAKARPAATRGRTASADRLPDGYMLLNGRRVPLGQLSQSPSSGPHRPALARPANRGVIVAALIVLGIVLLLVVSSLIASADRATPPDGEYAPLDHSFVPLEAASEAGSLLNVRWFDGSAWSEETEVEPGWTTDLVPSDDASFVVQVLTDDRDDIASCRILGADGVVLDESRNGSPGGAATCRWD